MIVQGLDASQGGALGFGRFLGRPEPPRQCLLISRARSNLSLFRYDDTGAGIDTPLAINRKTGAVTIKGVTDGSNAQAGMVGEYVSANVTSCSSSFIDATTTNYQMLGFDLHLLAGDWDVSANPRYCCNGGFGIPMCKSPPGISTSPTSWWGGQSCPFADDMPQLALLSLTSLLFE